MIKEGKAELLLLTLSQEIEEKESIPEYSKEKPWICVSFCMFPFSDLHKWEYNGKWNPIVVSEDQWHFKRQWTILKRGNTIDNGRRLMTMQKACVKVSLGYQRLILNYYVIQLRSKILLEVSSRNRNASRMHYMSLALIYLIPKQNIFDFQIQIT